MTRVHIAVADLGPMLVGRAIPRTNLIRTKDVGHDAYPVAIRALDAEEERSGSSARGEGDATTRTVDGLLDKAVDLATLNRRIDACVRPLSFPHDSIVAQVVREIRRWPASHAVWQRPLTRRVIRRRACQDMRGPGPNFMTSFPGPTATNRWGSSRAAPSAVRSPRVRALRRSPSRSRQDPRPSRRQASRDRRPPAHRRPLARPVLRALAPAGPRAPAGARRGYRRDRGGGRDRVAARPRVRALQRLESL